MLIVVENENELADFILNMQIFLYIYDIVKK
jgi:hypothetical protein